MEEYEYPEDTGKSTKGYQIVIIILALILGALSFMYFRQTGRMKADFAVERDTLSSRITRLVTDLGDLHTESDSVSYELVIARDKADSLLDRIQKERNFSASRIRQLEKEVTLLQGVARGFVRTIDSLNTLAGKLSEDNIAYRKQVATERLRADMAEEKANEFATTIRKGAVVIARGINLTALNSNDKEVTRASRAARLRVDLVLSANELATPGDRQVYARITGPDGYVLANAGSAVFDYEGDRLTYSAVREVDYQGRDLSVGLYYNGGGITEGKYQVAIYMDGQKIGSNEIILK